MTDNFSDLSISLTKSITKDVKKKGGIYFTPYNIIDKILDKIQGYEYSTVLEPCVGSGAFLDRLNSNLTIDAVEYNEEIYNEVSKMEKKISFYNEDYLKFDNKKKYDLIIGNPPYNVVKKSTIDEKYFQYIEGRPNIFTIFILHSLFKLSPDGILAFVLPNNFLNCIYYNKIRKFINENYSILSIEKNRDSKYLDTQQDTCSIIIQNSNDKDLDVILEIDNEKFVYNFDDVIVFTDDSSKFKQYNFTTLKKLDFSVSVGTVVWNQVKSSLTDDDTETLLIYSGDIKDCKLTIQNYKCDAKKNYILKKGWTEPVLVINRGYGKGKYKFSYCIIDLGSREFLIENHLICIRYLKKTSNKKLLDLYSKIIKSFEDERTHDFIENFFGNNAINCKELHTILPIFE